MSKRKQDAKKPEPGLQVRGLKPKTRNQARAFEVDAAGRHLVMAGSAGAGKSFLGMYFALRALFGGEGVYRKIVIIRSVVPSRDMGFLPGSIAEKSRVYAEPYRAIANDLLGRGDAWQILQDKGLVDFQTTSFLRSVTLANCFLLLDEMQNTTQQELDTVLTRIGEDCRFVLCGDTLQNDLTARREVSGFAGVLRVLKGIRDVETVTFGPGDCVRSGFVRDYLLEKERLAGLAEALA